MSLTSIVTLEGYEELDGFSGYDGVDEAILDGLDEILEGFYRAEPSIKGMDVTEGIYNFGGVLLSDDDLDHLSACAENIELQGFEGSYGLGDSGLGWKAFKKLKKAAKSVAKKAVKVVKSAPVAKVTAMAKRAATSAIRKGISTIKRVGLDKMIPPPYNVIAQNVMQFANKIPGLKGNLDKLKSQLGPLLQKAGVPPNLINDYINTSIKTQVGKTQVATAQSLKQVKDLQAKKVQELSNKLAASHKKELNASLNVQKGLLDLTAQINNVIYQAATGKPVQALKIPQSIANSPTVKQILPNIKKTIDTVQKRNVASQTLIKDQSGNFNTMLDLLY